MKMKLVKLCSHFLAMVLILLITTPTYSEEQRIHKMEEVVVSTSRTGVSVADAPQSITVISDREIMASPFERVEDILRFSAGVHNASHYGYQTGGIQSHLSMRGTGRNRVLMMLDGVPLNDNFSNSIAWVAWGLVPRESIERIEVLRGPSSASYGSEGLGGIINIITKKPAPARESSVRAIAGSSSTWGVSGLHAQRLGELGLLLSGSYEDSDGFYMVDPDDIEDFTERRHREVGKGFGKVTYSLYERTDISLSALYYGHEMGKGREFFYDELTLDQYRIGLDHRGDLADWKGMFYLNRADKTAYQDRRAGNRFIPDREEKFPENIVWGGEIQNTFPLFETTLLTAGAAYKRVSMEYEEKPLINPDREVEASGRQEFISPFVDLTSRFLDSRLIVNAGARYDNVRNHDGEARDTDPTFGREPYDEAYRSRNWDNISPKAGIVYHPDTLTTLRTSIVSGYRTPSLFELYKAHERGGGRFLRRANPNLDPEKIVSWEAGMERVFYNNLWARITYYRSRVTDYIGERTLSVTTDNGREIRDTSYDNIGRVNIHGIEAEMEYYLGSGLSSFANYTYNVSEVRRNKENPEIEGNYLPTEPRHRIRAGLTYLHPRFANATVLLKHDRDRYIDDLNTRKAPNFSTVDLSVWREFFDLATVRFTVENVTDEKEYIEDGRLYYGSIQFVF